MPDDPNGGTQYNDEHYRLTGDEADDLMDCLNRSNRRIAKFPWRYRLNVLFTDGTSSTVFINGSYFHFNGEATQKAASGSYRGAYEGSDIEAYLDDILADHVSRETTRQ